MKYFVTCFLTCFIELKAGNDNTPPVDIGVQGLKSSLDVKQIRKQMQQNRHNKELEQSSRLLKRKKSYLTTFLSLRFFHRSGTFFIEIF